MRSQLRLPDKERGALPVWLSGVIVVIAIYVVGSAGSLMTSGSGGSVPGSPSTCFTKCGFLMERRCEDDVYIGVCFLFWPCNAGTGAHTCTTPPIGDRSNSDAKALVANCSKLESR